MNILSILTAAIVLGVVWGGFIFILFSALRFEKNKTNNE